MRTCPESSGVTCLNSIRTAQEEGWAAFKNGQLLRRAAARFDVLVTIDQRMRYQQNFTGLAIGVVAIELPDTRLVFLRALLPQLRTAIENVRAGEVLVVKAQPT
jgi:hypothetical protein